MYADNTRGKSSRSEGGIVARKSPDAAATASFADHRPVAEAGRQLQAMADGSPRQGRLSELRAMAGNSARDRQISQLQRDAQAHAHRQMPSASMAVAQRVNNTWQPNEEQAIHGEDLKLGLNPSHEQTADAMLASPNRIYHYGTAPATDEQIEITAGASYLSRRKTDWRTELQSRKDALQTKQPRDEQPQSWEAYQHQANALNSQIAEPWFLAPGFGYDAKQVDNKDWISRARDPLDHPDEHDPQQIMGRTYDRDTSITSRSPWAGTQGIAVNGGSDAAGLAGKNGWMLRLFDNANQMLASLELRLRLTDAAAVPTTTRFSVTGTVVGTPHFSNGGVNPGTQVRCDQTDTGGIDLFAGNAVLPTRSLAAGWSGKLETPIYYQAVTVAEDSLGTRFQSVDPLRARNRSLGRNTDDAAVDELRARYDNSPPNTVNDNALGLERSLGPSRNRLNIEALGWDVSVARYRRLGGDLIFAEAPHAQRDLANYSNMIEPAGNVNVTDGDWYHDSQKDNPDRFVGGRSNSTLLYLKTASVLFQQGTLSRQQCLDVMAFAVADMVVSGEHSLPECMTTIVMAAENSPPWNTTALNIGQATSAMDTWRSMIDGGTVGAMRASARTALISQLGENTRDFKLLKSLVGLGKVLA